MPTPARTGNRSGTSARNEIIEMLKEDHKRAKKAFREFEKLDSEQNAEACEAIVRQTCAELTVHARLEEECFYSAARAALEEADLIDEAEVEHATVKQLIEQLQRMSAGDDKYGATFTVLGEYINHHVKEEEGEMFPQVSRTKLDWDGLLSAMTERRAELTEELMPEQAAADEGDAEPDVQPAQATTASRSSGRGSRAGSGTARPQASGRKGASEEK